MPSEYRITATEDECGARLDGFLAVKLPQFTRSRLSRLIESGTENSAVTVNGKPAVKSQIVKSGDVIDITVPDPAPGEAYGQDIPLDVRYEDDDVIVVNKPRGMVVHPSPGHADGTLVNALLSHCGGSLSGIGGVLRPGIVHRIDKDTAGLIIAAKNDGAHLSLSSQLKERTLSRVYDAIVRGGLKDETGTLSFPLGRHPVKRQIRAVIPISSGGKAAVTHYAVTERFPGYTRIECRLETGRTHQIRAHFAHIGHPLLGDKLYGGDTRFKLTGGEITGQALVAVRLSFIHPVSRERITVLCQPPDWYDALVNKLRNL